MIDDQDFKDLVKCALLTGMRQGEILTLRWDAIDFERKVVTVRNTVLFITKNKRQRLVPMRQLLWALLLKRRQNRGGDYVFSRDGKVLPADYVTKRFKFYIRKAGLDDHLHFHSLRHTFASWLVREGAPIYEVQRLLGHSSTKVTEMYAHLRPQQLQQTVNRIQIGVN